MDLLHTFPGSATQAHTRQRSVVALRPRTLVQADRGGRRHVEAFRAARHRDPHACVALAASSSVRPCASGPNSHAVGADKSASSMLIRRRPWWPAPEAGPAQRRHRRPASVSDTTGTEKMLPAEARKHLPLYGSTLWPASTTASAPIAWATRIRVPAFPGSEIPAATATSRGALARTSSNVVSGTEHTATKPTGVTVSDSAFAARSVTSSTGASANNAPNRAIAASVAKTSETSPRRNAASTRLGPSARKRAARRRPMWRCSLTAATTRAERSVSVRQPRRN